jgi:hypothetical protein
MNDSSTLTDMNVVNGVVISNYFHAESCNHLNQIGMSVLMTKCNFTIFLWWHCISPAGGHVSHDTCPFNFLTPCICTNNNNIITSEEELHKPIKTVLRLTLAVELDKNT